MITVNMHSVSRMEAQSGKEFSWLEVYDPSGCRVAMFMPFALAEQIAAIFEASENMTVEAVR